MRTRPVLAVLLLLLLSTLTACWWTSDTDDEPDPLPSSSPTTACPSPDPSDLLADPFVQREIQRAWVRSDPGTDDRREHGGWFTQHRAENPDTGEVEYWMEYEERGPGSAAALNLGQKPGSGDDVRVVAHFHTHPAADPMLDSGFAHEGDRAIAEGHGVPGIIRYGHGREQVLSYGPDVTRDLAWECPDDDDDEADDTVQFTGDCDAPREDEFSFGNNSDRARDYTASGSPEVVGGGRGTIDGGGTASVTVRLPQGGCGCEPMTAEGEITIVLSGDEEDTSVTVGTEIRYPAREDADCGGSSGDPHLRTFDGIGYSFQAVGEFVLVDSPGDGFEIQVRQAPWGSSRFVSMNTAVAADVAGDLLSMHTEGGVLHVDGEVADVADGDRLELPAGGALQRDGHRYEVHWPTGETLVVDNLGGSRGHGALTLTVALPPGREVAGLLGDRDGDPDDDLQDRDGTVFNQPIGFDSLYGAFADAWRVTPASSLFVYEPGEDTRTHTDRSFPDRYFTVDDLSDVQRAGAAAVCETAGVEGRALEECLIDVGLTGDGFFAEVAGRALGATTGLAVTEPGTRAGGGQVCHDHPAGSVGDGRAFGVDDPRAARADIVEHCVTSTPEELRFAVRVADPVDPATDPGWASPETALRWNLDVAGDDVTVTLHRRGDEPHATIALAEEGLLCDMVDAGLRDGAYVATFPGDCLGGAAFRYAVSLLYDADPSRPDKSAAPETIWNDVAPGQDGMVGPVAPDPS